MEQLLGQREPARAIELARRHAEFGHDRAAQVARGHAQVRREVLLRAIDQEPALDQRHRVGDQARARVDRAGGVAGRDLGAAFQRDVWRALCGIPFGATCGYGELAARLGRPSAARAVGAANGKNPIAIVVPCHRVIGKDGTLTGYAGGMAIKQWLLDHEARHRSA